MIAAPSPNNTAFGRGSILFARFDANGVKPDKYLHLGNCDQFAVSVSRDTVDQVNYMEATSAPYNSATKATDVALKLSGFEFNIPNFALMLSGDTTSVSQGSATVTDEEIAASTEVGLLGGFFRTAKRNISAVTVKQGATVLTPGTDYQIFAADTGIIQILPTGVVVVDGTHITASYTAAAIAARDVVRGFNTAEVKGAILFRSNNATGPNWDVEVYSTTIAPDGDIGFVSDDWLKWNLTGKALSDSAAAYGGGALDPFMRVTPR